MVRLPICTHALQKVVVNDVQPTFVNSTLAIAGSSRRFG